MTFDDLSRLPQIDHLMPNKLYTGSIDVYGERKRAWIESLK